ncbi:MAG: c-type cytochrome biogenesis protein CcmI [Leptospirillia bacterium]
MTVFWVIATAMMCAAVLFVVVPLSRGSRADSAASAAALNLAIRKDQLEELARDLESGVIGQEQYEAGRVEVERGLLEEADKPSPETKGAADAPRANWVVFATALAIPLLTVSLYMKFGSLSAMLPVPAAPQSQGEGHQTGPEQLAAMVQTLADRLAAQPDDPEGWMMLGRSYAVLRDHARAATAYRRAHELVGDHPDVLANLADALAMANNGQFTDESIRLIERAVEVDPTHQKSLWLAGTVFYERGDYARSLDYWERLQQVIPADSEVAATIAANVAEVRTLMGDAAPAPKVAPAPKAASAARITGVVNLAPELAGNIPDGAILFIFAKATSGPRMPLAIIREPVSSFPYAFELNADMGMMPGMDLSRFDQVVVGARISATGNAMAASGDLQGQVSPVAVGTEGLTVTIDSQVP